MSPIKSFKEFIDEGIVKVQSPDSSRARFLLEGSERDYKAIQQIIEQMGVNNANANILIKLCYDVLMETIRAKMLLKGYNAAGRGAHEAEVAYMRELRFKENDVQFTDQLRYFRNGIVYYGKILDGEYAQKVLEFLKKIYQILKKIQ